MKFNECNNRYLNKATGDHLDDADNIRFLKPNRSKNFSTEDSNSITKISRSKKLHSRNESLRISKHPLFKSRPCTNLKDVLDRSTHPSKDTIITIPDVNTEKIHYLVGHQPFLPLSHPQLARTHNSPHHENKSYRQNPVGPSYPRQNVGSNYPEEYATRMNATTQYPAQANPNVPQFPAERDSIVRQNPHADREWDTTQAEELFYATNIMAADPKVRRQFIKRVYLIVALLMLFSAICVLPFAASQDLKKWGKENAFVGGCFFVFYMIFCGILYFFPKIRGKYPFNYILLSLMVLSSTIFLCFITAAADTYSLLIALAFTSLACGLIGGLSLHYSYYSSSMSSKILIGVGVFIFLGAICALVLIFKTLPVMEIIASLVLTGIFIAFIVFECHQLFNGKRCTLREEDYLLAVIVLYMDMVFLFCFLSLAHRRSDR